MQPLTDADAQWSARPRYFARGGITLLEVMVVLALIGVVGTAIGQTLLRQQRFYRGTSELLHAREGVRDAMELLSTDIRGMAVADTVRLLADSAIEFFANIGSSVVCQRLGTTAVGLPGVSLGRGNVLTAFTTAPDTGDFAVFLKDSVDAGTEWERHRISGFGPRSLAVTCPASTDLGRNADIAAGTTGFLLELSTPLGGTVSVGAPVRFVRRGRYSLYHGSDGDWYLGYRRCNAVGASSCGPIQPLSGPYRDYSSDPERTGLRFEYFDRSGRRLAPNESALGLARIDVTARAESRQRLSVEGHTSVPADSATIAIAIRNRSP
jgi:prepilin-type N-terminal cleavage/methylation domain-containing protein